MKARAKRFVDPLLESPGASHRIENLRTGRIVAEHVVGAFDSKTRRVGLLHHDRFPAGEGLIIAPTNAIHTFFMRFAIDVAFLSKAGVVVKISTALRPWRMSATFRAFAVLELPAGTLAQTGTIVGDTLQIVESA